MRLALLAALPALFLSGLACAPADARARRTIDVDTVVAQSRFGNGSVTGAVRNTSLGPQVQLPTGRWVYCRRSCSETLRVETIDFNLNSGPWRGAGGLANECGIFGCLDIGLDRRRYRD